MDLRHFLFEKDMSVAKFAREIGISQQHASLIKKKKHIPSFSTMIKMIEYSEGKITPYDLLPKELFEAYEKVKEKKDETN